MSGLPLTSGPLPSQPSAKCTLGSVASTSSTHSLPLCHVPATAGHFYPSPLRPLLILLSTSSKEPPSDPNLATMLKTLLWLPTALGTETTSHVAQTGLAPALPSLASHAAPPPCPCQLKAFAQGIPLSGLANTYSTSVLHSLLPAHSTQRPINSLQIQILLSRRPGPGHSLCCPGLTQPTWMIVILALWP